MPRQPFPLTGLLAGLLLAAAGSAVAAPEVDPRWALCPPLPANPPVAAEESDVTRLSADQATAEGEDRSVFNGDVVVIRGAKRLDADEAVYDKRTDTLDVKGNVSFYSQELAFSGERAQLRLGEETGFLEGARYSMRSARAFGTAERVEFMGADRSRLKRATYTTCPPSDESWLLDAREITLDRGTNTGEARDVTVKMGGVPVMYLPYLNFALEGRKSGFLAPSFGSSERNGNDVRIPWYWNIAPNRDATLAPRLISERGGMLMSEFRYLNPDNSGEIALDVLPNDALHGGTRSYVRARHAHRISPRWSAYLDYQEVSDPAYLNDIDNTLASSSTRYLERRFDLGYRGDGWSFVGRMQNFQPLQLGVDDYQRWPQLVATGAGRRGPLRYDFRAEYVNFDSQSRDPTGSRADLYPGLSLPLGGAAWFLTPRVAARHTVYDLTGAPVAEHSRTVPMASLDGGLFFERETNLFATPLVQTLEPRLYYLHVPFREQGDLPTFDTEPMTFSFNQLFRENRFTGPDRVGDADQVTAALTTRFLRADTGEEALRASLGQIYYFSDPRVVLPGQPVETRHTSDIAGELAARPIPGLEISGATRWNPEIENAEESAARIRFQSDDRHVIDLAWRYRNAGAEMNRDMLVLWPLTPRWHVVGRWYYDLIAERTLESVIGLEYESCCWSVRVVSRDKPFLDNTGALQSDRSIYFTLELKGLANLGDSLASVIEDGMVGL